MKKIILLLLILVVYTGKVNGQLKTISFKAASNFLNPATETAASTINVKSSYAVEAPVVQLSPTYTKAIKISYQIPATHAWEWAILRVRASNILDREGGVLYGRNPTLYNSILNLAIKDFVTLSSYGPLNVKLDFKYNKTKSYNAEEFAPVVTGTVIGTKTLMIR